MKHYTNFQRSCYAYRRRLKEIAMTDTQGPYSLGERDWLPEREGYRLYLWCKEVLPSLDLTVHSFFISKSEIPGLARKGQYLMSEQEADKVVKAGGRIREIHCHKKETRKAFKALLELQEDGNGKLRFGRYHALGNGSERQMGFTLNKDIFDSILSHETAGFFNKGNVMQIDLQDAFQQIRQDQIEEFVRIVFDLNKRHARQFAEACCFHGRLFQGNPIAPALFNALTVGLNESLNNVLQGGYATQYADDILIVTKKHISRRYKRFLLNLISQHGLKVNEEKTRERKLRQTTFLGVVYSKKSGEPPRLVAKGQRRLKKQVRYLRYLTEQKQILESKRHDKAGNPIKLTAVLTGIEEWLERVKQASAELEMEIYWESQKAPPEEFASW